MFFNYVIFFTVYRKHKQRALHCSESAGAGDGRGISFAVHDADRREHVQSGRGQGAGPPGLGRPAAGLRAHGVRPEAAGRSRCRRGGDPSAGRAARARETRVRQDVGHPTVPGQERCLR